MNHVMTVASTDGGGGSPPSGRPPGDRVLDGCCGTGDLALAARRAGAGEVVGLDFSEEMLVRAHRKARTSLGGGDLLRLRSQTASSTRRRSASGSETSTTSRRGCANCGAS